MPSVLHFMQILSILCQTSHGRGTCGIVKPEKWPQERLPALKSQNQMWDGVNYET